MRLTPLPDHRKLTFYRQIRGAKTRCHLRTPSRTDPWSHDTESKEHPFTHLPLSHSQRGDCHSECHITLSSLQCTMGTRRGPSDILSAFREVAKRWESNGLATPKKPGMSAALRIPCLSHARPHLGQGVRFVDDRGACTARLWERENRGTWSYAAWYLSVDARWEPDCARGGGNSTSQLCPWD